MKPSLFRVTLLIAALSTCISAQRGRGNAIVSPEVSPEGKVTFRLRAPNAKEVGVNGFGQRIPMEKNEQGVWSATTGVLKPDLYEYSFSVDGANFPDPANALLKSAYGTLGQSMVRVPGHEVWDPADGPRGVVSHHFYKSALIGDTRDFYVYTPPNYDPARKEPYPVFFVLHGLGDDASGWLTAGAANIILDNLINQGKAKPMIMVNTLGYGTTDGPRGAMGATMIPTFASALVDEVLPQVEKEYHVSKDRTQHAIAGLSMGGAESLYTGLHNINRFAYIGSFSGAFVMWPRANPAPPRPPADAAAGEGGRGGRGGRGGGAALTDADFEKNFPNLDSKATSQLKLIWIACGTEDSLLKVNQQFKAWLDAKGISTSYQEVPGYAHVWPLWRRNLAELAPLLFQGKK